MPRQTDRTREGLNTRPIVAITMGDPCGVGPEIIVKAFDSPGFAGECVPLVIGDSLPLERAIKLLGSSAVIRPMTGQMLRSFRSVALTMDSGTIPLLAPAAQDGSSTTGLTPADIEFGKPSPAACEAAVSCIRTAVGLAVAGSADAVCTCPINKEQLHRQGFPFAGHTEFIRELTLGRRRGHDACRTQAQGGARDDSRGPGRRPGPAHKRAAPKSRPHHGGVDVA